MNKISIKKTAAAAAAAVMMAAGLPALGVSAATSTTYSYTFPYYSAVTGLYYNDYNQAVSESDGNAQHVYNGYYIANGTSLTSSAAFPYYSTYTNKYYATYAAALAASEGVASRVVSNGVSSLGYTTSYSVNYPYYSSYTGRYYATFDEAVAASLGRTGYVTRVNADIALGSYPSGYPYYSRLTGKYYATYKDALKASANKASEVVYLTTSSIVYPAYYYSNPYYYSYYGYYYPYYVPTVTTTATVTAASAAADGVPFLYGNNKVWGWTTLSTRITKGAIGSYITVDMNGATLVPSEILKATKQRSVNLRLVLQNGAVWDINGANIYNTEEGDFSVTYGTNVVPDSLVKAASKDAVSFAEITVGSARKPIDLSANLTVKFSAKRADCFAKIYLYNETDNTLKLVDKSQVDSKGYVVFNVKSSGSYIVVLS